MAKEKENNTDDTKQEETINKEVDKQVDDAGKQAKAEAENKGLSEQEVNERIEAARKEEKDKLYGQIDSLKSDFKKVQDYLEAEREEKETIKKEAEKKADDERKSKLSDQERMNEILQNLEEQLTRERKERERFEKRLADKEKKEEIRRYRDTLIASNQDEIIPELVLGDTKEELDEALKIAKVRYKEYEERFKAEKSQQVKHGLKSTNPDYEGLEDLELSKDLTAIDRDKYLDDPEYRAKIQGELENEYERLAGRI